MNHQILTFVCLIETMFHFVDKSSANLVRSSCDPSWDICEFQLTFGLYTAMLRYQEDEYAGLTRTAPVTVLNNGSLFLRDMLTCDLAECLEEESPGNIFIFSKI